MKRISELELVQNELKKILEDTNHRIEDLGNNTNNLLNKLNEIQLIFDKIRGIPSEEKLEIEKLKKVRQNWYEQAKKIESEYNIAEKKVVGAGAAGVGAGVAVVALGPTAAMGIATTFGVASTGTAISTLYGAAATNAALAWLGGGALTAGGGGIVAGNAVLALAGPIGWSIAGVVLLGSGFMFLRSRDNKKRLENIFINIGNRDIYSYQLAIVELNERIKRIISEIQLLEKTIVEAQGYGNDYDIMSEEQQYKLISFVNLMNSSTQLLVNPILGLQPKFVEGDLLQYFKNIGINESEYENIKKLQVFLANLLYRINLEDKDQKLLRQSLLKNKEFIKAMEVSKKDFDLNVINQIELCLAYKYGTLDNN